MQSNNYKVLFSGQTLENVTLDTAKSNLRKLLGASDEIIERLFTGNSVVIKRDLDRKQADQYVSALNKAGLAVKTDPPIVAELNLELEASEPVSSKPADSASSATEKPAPQVDNPYSSPASQDLLPGVHCRQCGAKISANDAVCNHCGASQPIGQPRSKVTAGLLAICLGWLGAHRFYLGQWVGIFYFLFGMLAWPIAIIEGIVFLVTPKDRWDEKYGNVKGLGAVMILVIGFILFIAVVGILAAIAIPAYNDYSIRAKVHEAMPTVEKTKERLERYILTEQVFPGSNREAGLPEVITGKNLLSIKVQRGGNMQVIFKSDNSGLNEKSILWIPEVNNGLVNWDCSGGSLPKRHRPNQCREGQHRVTQAPGKTQRFVADNGLVELTVPQSWKRQELSEDAIVQLGNIYSEAYLLVHAENKLDLAGYELKSYADAILETISGNLNNAKIRHIGNSTVNGLTAIHYRADGSVEDIDLIYLVTIVEGKDHFYQVIAWSLVSRFSGNVDDFNYAINSFREREPTP